MQWEAQDDVGRGVQSLQKPRWGIPWAQKLRPAVGVTSSGNSTHRLKNLRTIALLPLSKVSLCAQYKMWVEGHVKGQEPLPVFHICPLSMLKFFSMKECQQHQCPQRHAALPLSHVSL